MSHQEFNRVVAAYKAEPTPTGLQALLRVALYLEPEPTWRHVRGKEAFAVALWGDTRRLRPHPGRGGGNARFTGCLGYALKAMLAGQELGDPFVCYPVADGRIAFTVLEFGYTSASSTRTDPDFFQAFATARTVHLRGYARANYGPRRQGHEGHAAGGGHCPLQPQSLYVR